MRFAAARLTAAIVLVSLLIGCERDTERLLLLWLIRSETSGATFATNSTQGDDFQPRSDCTSAGARCAMASMSREKWNEH